MNDAVGFLELNSIARGVEEVEFILPKLEM